MRRSTSTTKTTVPISSLHDYSQVRSHPDAYCPQPQRLCHLARRTRDNAKSPSKIGFALRFPMAKVKMFPARKLQPVRNQALPYRELRANAMRAHELQPTRWKRAVISHHIAPRRKETEMNRDIVAGKWQQLRGKVKEEWGKLTDDDLTTTEGRRGPRSPAVLHSCHSRSIAANETSRVARSHAERGRVEPTPRSSSCRSMPPTASTMTFAWSSTAYSRAGRFRNDRVETRSKSGWPSTWRTTLSTMRTSRASSPPAHMARAKSRSGMRARGRPRSTPEKATPRES